MEDDTQSLKLATLLSLLAAEHDGEAVVVQCPDCGARVPADLIASHRVPVWQTPTGRCGVA